MSSGANFTVYVDCTRFDVTVADAAALLDVTLAEAAARFDVSVTTVSGSASEASEAAFQDLEIFLFQDGTSLIY